jgi:peptidoglycan hydrolase-like protein with peptidoglycan-binding domain
VHRHDARQGSAGPERTQTRTPTRAPANDASGPDHVAALQQLVGNQAVAAIFGGIGAQRLDEDGDPQAPAAAGTSTHPTLRLGSRGPGVEELQQKLNGAGADLVVDGEFGPVTAEAVKAFQGSHACAPDGVVGALTWTALDDASPATTVGRVQKQWGENVNGQHYAMTSRYTWRLQGDEIRTTVRLRFTGAKNSALVALWFGAIRSVWNTFDAVNENGEIVHIVFDPVEADGGADNTIQVHLGPPGTVDAGNWYTEDPDQEGTAQHEFGHMVGLEDEYGRDETDYTRLTGEEHPDTPSGTNADGTPVYDSTSLMGNMSDHDHPVAPRHVRAFAEYVKLSRGGEWTVQAR